MGTPIRIGIAGLGTVGIGVIKILRECSNIIEERLGKGVEVIAVTAKSKEKKRDENLDGYTWEESPINLVNRNDIDIFVELIGGTDGVAHEAVKLALSKGKHVVTANKAMLAVHGKKLAELAESNNVSLKLEAAVAGGIPVIKVITESLAGSNIKRVMGVINGSCNYILTRMEKSGLSFETIFNEANALGYLEADPQLDVGGIDAAHKIAIISSLSFGTVVNFDGVTIQGIEKISIDDIKHAADMGYRIKLLATAQITELGLEQRVTPCLVPDHSPLGGLEGGTNMVVIDTIGSDPIILQGPGAGRIPTANAVVSDIIDIIRGSKVKTFGKAASLLKDVDVSKGSTNTSYYIRLLVDDKPGTLAKVTATLGNEGISINRLRQYDHEASKAPVIIVTHETTSSSIEIALKKLSETGVVSIEPVALRIEE